MIEYHVLWAEWIAAKGYSQSHTDTFLTRKRAIEHIASLQAAGHIVLNPATPQIWRIEKTRIA